MTNHEPVSNGDSGSNDLTDASLTKRHLITRISD